MSSRLTASSILTGDQDEEVQTESSEAVMQIAFHGAVTCNRQTAVLAHPLIWMAAGLSVFATAFLFPPNWYAALFADTCSMHLDLLSGAFTISCVLMIFAGYWSSLGGSIRGGTPRLLVGTDLDNSPLTTNLLLLLLTLGNIASCAIFIHYGGLRVIADALQGADTMNRGMREMAQESGGQLWLATIVLSSIFAPLGYQQACSVRRHPWTRPLFILFVVTYVLAALLTSRRNYIARPLFGVLLTLMIWPPVKRLTLRGAVAILSGAAAAMLVVFSVLGILRRGLTESSEVFADVLRYIITPYNTQSEILHGVVRMPGQGTVNYWLDWLWDFPVLSDLLKFDELREYLLGERGLFGAFERAPILIDQGIETGTAIPAFACSWLDLGWLGVIPFFFVGLVCGWCWKGFLRGSSVSLLMYPTIAYSFLEWRANLLFPSVMTSYALVVVVMIVLGRWLERGTVQT